MKFYAVTKHDERDSKQFSDLQFAFYDMEIEE